MTPPVALIWLDMQLPPALAPWIEKQFQVRCAYLRTLGHDRSEDRVIFDEARAAGAIIVSKDADFARLVGSLGPPPTILWLRCGNTSRAALQRVFEQTLPPALVLLEQGECLVEILG